ncbi:MAG: thiamine phosphate synthase [Bacteroidales bacterium]|nr:thiamine phosphate synthase [Bacteroidales bacterium]MBD5242120.1 thiamine phosphate synthase [Barnesiella sp.]MDE5821603.1 thiamine phosphate synthase [Paramuribaculum sp.]MDE5837275.1 thiamine phosphate synthase [Paramuribaculum sp.]
MFMLQFITHQSDRFSIPEEAQMAIEGGCRWIQLRMKDASDDEVRAVANEIIPLCKENDTFLIIDDRVELVNELRVSGVHLGKEDMDPMEARDILGPHAIIGVTANTAEDIIRFKGKDVDYVGLGPVHFTTTKAKLSPELGIEGVKRVIDEVRANGVELPIVAIGGVTENDIEPLLAAGVNGIAVSGAIINADDPVELTSKMIERLQK